MKYIIDTSFFVALFLVTDVNHEKAKKILISKKLTLVDIVLNDFVIEETFTILTYKWWKKLSNNFSNSLKVLNIIYSSTSIQQYIHNYNLIDTKISFADIWVIYDGLNYNCELISFDKQQKSIYKKLKSQI